MPHGCDLAYSERPRVGGKFIFTGDEKLYVRGVTYGTFADGGYPRPANAARDFAAMAENEVNTVRVYTVPPRWLLDLAAEHGLRVLVGIPWEQHVVSIDERKRSRSIEDRVRTGVSACAGHRAVLGYAIGNEIPASIVRWHGRRRVEHFLERLYRAAKAEDPDGLVTYVNFPSTEYLQLPFVDLACFNVYLETPEALQPYIVRLQNLAGDRPLLLTEIGLDSRRNGELAQAAAVQWQIRTAFAAGCAGAVVFAWTDEWARGGDAVDDWDFGVTDRARRPKPALRGLRDAFRDAPVARGVEPWPRVSVVVCSYNGASTIAACLDSVTQLSYPNYEVIVVDDGSTDETSVIAQHYPVRVTRTENRGLSAARNTGLGAATGELVAYVDDDCMPDRDWLSYVALAFRSTRHAAVGGPNVPPPDGRVAACVARAPGGPTHVLVSDQEAEHIPGCNMTFRKDVLERLGGFDPQFIVAGDDVDICWRLQNGGWTIGYSAAAMVWHRRRSSVRAYLRQQRGYGEAEGLLERKWPERYNFGGHPRWRGRMYGDGAAAARVGGRWRIYYGTCGSGLFQSVYRPAPGVLRSLPLMPEWYLMLATLAVLALGGAVRPELALDVPGTHVPGLALLLVLATVATLGQGLASAWRAFPQFAGARSSLLGLRLLTAALHVLQPAARLVGRLRHGLTPWRRRPAFGYAFPWPRTAARWSEDWQEPAEQLRALDEELRSTGAMIVRGDAFARWDLEARVGNLGSARVRMAVEEHGHGKQLFRFRVWPRWSPLGILTAVALASSAGYLGAVHDVAGAMVLAVPAAWLALRAVGEPSAAEALVLAALAGRGPESVHAPDLGATLVAIAAHPQRRPLETKPVAEVAD
jgi:GT2 family glycosyltransferase